LSQFDPLSRAITFLASVIMAPAYPKVRVKGVAAAMEMMRRVAAALEKALLHFF
jgi:hypothetical protein